MEIRSPQNRVKNWTGTVHYADMDGKPACGSYPTHSSYYTWSVATVTCKRCIAAYGEDDQGHTDLEHEYHADDHAARRAAERAERQAAQRG